MMIQILMVMVILLPICTGVLAYLMHRMNRKGMMEFVVEALVILTSVLVFVLVANANGETVTIFRFTGNLSITFKLDAIGKFFACLVAFLWPFATLYSFEYMEHEEGDHAFYLFYLFYTATYGITLGVALSENILTMYVFFEMLSLITLPLIMHTRTRDAILASRSYLFNMLGGAAFAFVGMIFILTYGSTSSFVAGGVIDPVKLDGRNSFAVIIFFLSFCGFAVKTAMWPMSSWLPKAGVAPTPVTALLHAVAVVNTGAFAVMRLTYFSFGTEMVKGTWAHSVLMCMIIFTIVYGCSRAVKETHFKRRLAWSTVSNLSYILFGVILMSPLGLAAGLCHMLVHSFIKITSFFCAGSIITKAEKDYIYDFDGLGQKMPKVCTIFTISAFALMGVPGLPGFVSKWNLAKAALAEESILASLGVGALLISALLTAIYMLTVVVRFFFPAKGTDLSGIAQASDPGPRMMIPLYVFVIMMFVLAFGQNAVMTYFLNVLG